MEKIKKLSKDEPGGNFAEYGLLVAIIALIIIAVASNLGTGVRTMFQNAAIAMPN